MTELDDRENAPRPTDIKLRRRSRLLEVTFDNGERFELPFEYLRVFSPSAEVYGHGAGEPKLVPGKREVHIERIESVGNYAVRLVFDDGHDTGLYSWYTLNELGRGFDVNWRRYVARLEAAGHSRDRAGPPGAELGITFVDENGQSQ